MERSQGRSSREEIDDSRKNIKPLTIKQLQEYPPEVIQRDIPNATREARAQVAQGRDGPFDLCYKVYGHGPRKVLCISGHGAGIEDWYGLVRHIGIENGDKYTIVIFENRGIGKSKAPWGLWSTKVMAMDAKDLLDRLGWNEDRSVHVVGHSMGGMIAQELVIHYASIIASLTLLSTTSHWFRDIRLWNIFKALLMGPFLVTANSRLSLAKRNQFGQEWLSSPDPTGTFPTNGDAWAARFITWPIHVRGALLQTPAAVRHRVDAMQLRKVAEMLGHGRVAIVHGWSDRNIPVSAAERMWEEFGGGETGVKIVVLDGVGHIPQVEREKDVIGLAEGVVNGTLNVRRSGINTNSASVTVAK